MGFSELQLAMYPICFFFSKSRSTVLIYVVFLSFRVCLPATGKNRKYTNAHVPASVYEQLTADQGGPHHV